MKDGNWKKFRNKILKGFAKQNRDYMPSAEKSAWSMLSKNQFGYTFYRQRVVGRWIFDFYCPALRLAIEIDGASHLEPAQIKEDALKEQYAKDCAIHVMRFTNEDMRNHQDYFKHKIKEFVKLKESGQYRKNKQ